MSSYSAAFAEPSSPAASLRLERDRFVAFAFTWADLLLEVQPDGRIIYAAGATEPFLGHSAPSLAGRTLQDLVPPEQRQRMDAMLAAARRGERLDDAMIDVCSASGTPLPVGVTGYQLPELGGHIFVGLRCRTSAPGTGAAGRAIADDDVDAETGLSGVRPFVEALSRLSSNAQVPYGQSLSLIRLVGWDRIQQQLQGNAAQDLMRNVGLSVRERATDGDLAARIAPDGLALLHPRDVDFGQLEAELLAHATELDPGARGLSIERSSFEMIQGARLAGEVVAKGMTYLLNRFRCEAEDASAMRALPRSFPDLVKQAVAAIEELRAVVAARSYDVVFQPIVHALRGDIAHYEALARFPRTPALNGPAEHIMLAEEIGLISEIDIGMARKVVDWMHQRKNTLSERIAINVSGQSVTQPDYVTQLYQLLGDNSRLQTQLLFEITESSRMDDLTAANAFVLQLRKRGVRVCLDDFGAGAANFEYLARLDVDVVKFDGPAVRSARNTLKGSAFLQALVGVCSMLKIASVIEMVDSQASLDFARATGADFVQGYLFGKPSANLDIFRRTMPTHLFQPLQSF